MPGSDHANRSAKLRAFFASFVAERGAVRDPRIAAAFAAVPREPFAGPPPWYVLPTGPWLRGRGSYLAAPDDDPAFLYQDVLVAIDRARGINIGEPSLHAHCLDALALMPGETVLQVGAGSGYYTAILAELVGPKGHVHGFEIDPGLGARAERNLALWPWVRVHQTSGIVADLPSADAIYVNAGITQPSWTWLNALNFDGRLLFPLQAPGGFGGMLLVQKPKEGGIVWPARIVCRAAFISCQGRQDESNGRTLTAAFAGGGWERVRSLHLGGKPNMSCWCRGDDWWLSTEPPGKL